MSLRIWAETPYQWAERVGHEIEKRLAALEAAAEKHRALTGELWTAVDELEDKMLTRPEKQETTPRDEPKRDERAERIDVSEPELHRVREELASTKEQLRVAKERANEWYAKNLESCNRADANQAAADFLEALRLGATMPDPADGVDKMIVTKVRWGELIDRITEHQTDLNELRQQIEAFVRMVHEDGDATIEWSSLRSILAGIWDAMSDYRESAAENQSAADTLERLRKGEIVGVQRLVNAEGLRMIQAERDAALAKAAELQQSLVRQEEVHHSDEQAAKAKIASLETLAERQRRTIRAQAEKVAELEEQEHEADKTITHLRDYSIELEQKVADLETRLMRIAVPDGCAVIDQKGLADYKRDAERWRETLDDWRARRIMAAIHRLEWAVAEKEGKGDGKS